VKLEQSLRKQIKKNHETEFQNNIMQKDEIKKKNLVNLNKPTKPRNLYHMNGII